MSINLSMETDDGDELNNGLKLKLLELILLKMPVKDLIKTCTQVSPLWNKVLEDNFFWKKKMEEDGYKLEKWPKLVDLSTKSFKWMALKHCFERNFLEWNLESHDGLGPWLLNAGGPFARIEIPPKFRDGQPKIPPGYNERIAACVAIPNDHFTKDLDIRLADEGLTNEIMDNYRPTIVVSEMVANRRDCASTYAISCSLTMDENPFYYIPYDKNQLGNQQNFVGANGRWVGAVIALRFKQGEDEDWQRVELSFTDYPIGMRYLQLKCLGEGNEQNPAGHYGLKLANCSVKALGEKNAAE